MYKISVSKVLVLKAYSLIDQAHDLINMSFPLISFTCHFSLQAIKKYKMFGACAIKDLMCI